MQHRLLQLLFLCTGMLPMLTACRIHDGAMDFSPVSDRLDPALNDDVILDGDYHSVSAPIAAAPKPLPAPPAAAPAPQPTPENPFVAAESHVAPKPVALPTTTRPKAETAKAGAAYTVTAGDTLTGVARRHGVTPAALAAANGLTPTAGLKIGQKIIIPGKGSPAGKPTSSAPASKPAAKPTNAKARAHTVQTGDTIYRIARQYGVSPAALMQANKLTPQTAGTIKTGTTLTIPAK